MKRLSKKQMILFAIGQLGWATLSGIISACLVRFYMPTGDDFTKLQAVQYIEPALVIGGFMTILGLITALGRVFDAVTDPWIASMSDKCKSPRGRRTPFMMIAALPLAVVTVLIFTPFWGSKDPLNIVWLSILLVLFYLFMTMYCTPYNSLISEYGKTQEDRMFISTAISLTFFVGTLLAYVPYLLVDILAGFGLSFAWGFRIPIIVMAVIAFVAMLFPVLFLKEKEFVDTEPSKSNVFKSLGATFKNKEFRIFAASDIMYWVGLTMFQTGLPYYVSVNLHLGNSMSFVLLAAMTVLSACFYPFVTRLVKKFGKKKLVITGFVGLSIAYLITALTGFNAGPEPTIIDWIMGIGIVLVAAFPMALLGVIPQSMVADVAEADAKLTGENREGMFFAARTFAMKFGQALAMILFTSLAMAGQVADPTKTEISPSILGLRLTAIVAIAFCLVGAIILFFYREKYIMKTIAKESDAEFMRAIEKDEK